MKYLTVLFGLVLLVLTESRLLLVLTESRRLGGDKCDDHVACSNKPNKILVCSNGKELCMKIQRAHDFVKKADDKKNVYCGKCLANDLQKCDPTDSDEFQECPKGIWVCRNGKKNLCVPIKKANKLVPDKAECGKCDDAGGSGNGGGDDECDNPVYCDDDQTRIKVCEKGVDKCLLIQTANKKVADGKADCGECPPPCAGENEVTCPNSDKLLVCYEKKHDEFDEKCVNKAQILLFKAKQDKKGLDAFCGECNTV